MSKNFPAAQGSFPADLALAATFNPALVRRVGEVIALQARKHGFNLVRVGGVNLIREVRSARNFEYLSEDPFLSGVMRGEMIAGIQSQRVIAALTYSNDFSVAQRESDLLALQIAIERGRPGSLTCLRNDEANPCATDPILNGVVSRVWGYPGWIQSDWRTLLQSDFSSKALGQQSADPPDTLAWFDQTLHEAVADGKVSRERISEHLRRMLGAYFAVGLDNTGTAPTFYPDTYHAVMVEAAREGIVLLKNENRGLPLASRPQCIAVIGGDDGVARELVKLLPDARITHDSGAYPENAAALAKECDVAIVFVVDAPDLSLPLGQDAVIAAVADANAHTIVVLQNGTPVSMPWRDHVQAILHAPFAGDAGPRAIAEVLTGKINPSGRLPFTYPADVTQTLLAAQGEADEVGYGGFATRDAQPLFAFGYGLSYTTFAYSDVSATVVGDTTVRISFTVTNTGAYAGADVPQLYLLSAPDSPRLRLLGFERVSLYAGKSRRVTITADARLLARFDHGEQQWRIDDGNYTVALARAADAPLETRTVQLRQRWFGR